MDFNILVNQRVSQEWGLTVKQAFFFAYLYKLPSWSTKAKLIDDDQNPYHWVTQKKIIEDLPLLSIKPESIRTYFKPLEDKGLIKKKTYTSTGRSMMFIQITAKAKEEWSKDWEKSELPTNGFPVIHHENEPTCKKIHTHPQKFAGAHPQKFAGNPSTNNPDTNTYNNTASDDAFWLKIRNIYKEYNFIPGNKQQALSAFKKLRLDESQVEHLIKNTDAHLSNKRKILDSGEFVSNPPHVVRWIKHRGWEDELDVSNKNVKPIVNQQRKIRKF
jgi:DNA-binding MarR family transcriptional regulator